ncbi:hypothetical protein ASC80_03270 [Afipia sp. Root123D2]|uniref:hypothetical protein n=1 Tax=Afipia sp. Root123D2 TaxID=1736436 RepID=UPI0007015940|nr:hypothetical protein [Afipia sp. Root123D2]KQW22423.1 hypothetical protein ASC80_03270 [Afipia sp. Root123D2]
MRALRKMLFVLAAILSASAMTPAAALDRAPLSDAVQSDVVQVQSRGGNCANWQRQCARLYGGGTYQWNACMNQPQAQYDCGRGGYGGGYGRGGYGRGGYGGGYRDADLCANWHNECTRLYGRGQAYRACLRQPQARADCGRY